MIGRQSTVHIVQGRTPRPIFTSLILILEDSVLFYFDSDISDQTVKISLPKNSLHFCKCINPQCGIDKGILFYISRKQHIQPSVDSLSHLDGD